MKLSVSVVTYQQERFVAETLASVLAQETDFDFEVIVGDDASRDRTPNILQEIRATATREVRLLLARENYGDSGLSNFMATVDAARGDYIAFIDGDDLWSAPYKLQRQVDFLDRHPDCVICAHRVQHRFDDGKILLSPRPGRGDRSYPIERLLISNFAEKISTIVRRDALDALPGWYRTTSAISADWLFNLLVGRAGRIGYLDEVLAVHRLHSDSISMRQGTPLMLRDNLNQLQRLRPHLPGVQGAFLQAEFLLRTKLAMLRASPRGYMLLKELADLSVRR